ncbi:unnamed protein product [marine sediment metagenome]|uniref:Uncharacterized protein n=1 Tax=marine sediment metagenome TaxID=412755 RepID=X0UQK4_9ZZZZ
MPFHSKFVLFSNRETANDAGYWTSHGTKADARGCAQRVTGSTLYRVKRQPDGRIFLNEIKTESAK